MNPHRIKIFNSATAEDLEKKVNGWLMTVPKATTQITYVIQSESKALNVASYTISIFYVGAV